MRVIKSLMLVHSCFNAYAPELVPIFYLWPFIQITINTLKTRGEEYNVTLSFIYNTTYTKEETLLYVQQRPRLPRDV